MSAKGVALSLAALLAGVAAVVLSLRSPAPLRRAAAGQLYVNEAIRTLVTRPVLGLGRASDTADRRLVDGAVDGAGRAGLALARASDTVERGAIDRAVDRLAAAVREGGDDLRRVQSGRLWEYLRATVAGAAAVAAVVVVAALT